MKTTIEALIAIKNTKGTNDKIQLLSTKKDEKMLLSVLNLLFNPTISTKIGRNKINKDVNVDIMHKSINSDLEFLDFLQKNCTGKDSDILSIQEYIDLFQTKEEREVLSEIACQTLSIGMDYKNVNKALGYTLIDSLEPMLAFSLEKRLPMIKEGTLFNATTKLDGFRCLIKYTDDGMAMYSRNGLQIEGVEKFLDEIKNNLPVANAIYDGELLTQIIYAYSKDAYKAISKIARNKGEKNKNLLCFHCFDYIPLDEFVEGKSAEVYKDRMVTVNSIVESDYIKAVKSLGIFTVDDTKLYSVLDECVAKGEEGVMLNQLDAYYEGKRSTGILKMKQFHTVDILCTGIEEGSGNFKGTLGSAVMDYKGYKLNVGSGFSQEQREFYWNNPDEIIGKIVEVKYFEETNNQSGGVSLRFPIFLHVRHDKNEPSYN
ncbi:MAG: hypothetical protein ACRCZ0_08355 [Cetobacterium sp.]